jgi:putative transposase
VLKQWFGTYRYVYNKSISSIKKGHVNKFQLRNQHVTSKNNTSIKQWELSTPKAVRQQAVYDACKAFTTCISQLKSGLITKFDLRYKTKKKKRTSIGIENSPSLKLLKGKDNKMYLNLFPQFIPKIRIGKRQKKELQSFDINTDCRLCFDGCDLWLCAPTTISNGEPTHRNEDNIIALDPGVRTFQTGYDPNGKTLHFHRNDDYLKHLKERIALMQSLRSKGKKVDSRKYRKRLDNAISDFHWKTIKTLTDNYKKVLLPHFESQEMRMKSNNRHMNRELDTLCHYKFKQRLYFKASLTKTKVYDVDESYTTMTCTNCGVLNYVGNNSIYKCASCHLVTERDMNGSRNILLKHVC